MKVRKGLTRTDYVKKVGGNRDDVSSFRAENRARSHTTEFKAWQSILLFLVLFFLF